VSLFAVLDGHGGVDCATFVADRMPALLAEALEKATASSDIKVALKQAFARCEAELQARIKERAWCDGCCCVALLVDRRCSPARAYCANLGDSRAFAAVTPSAAAATAPARAVALTKADHTAIDPKERKRIEAAGGTVDGGRVCGVLEVSRSFGDARLKSKGVSAVPDVTSFEIKPGEQRFVVLGCDGFWKAFSGTQAVERLHAKLPSMDARRTELAALLDDKVRVAGLTKEAHAAALRERADAASEDGLLRAMVHEAVHSRHATDNTTLMLVRLNPD
jgi:integrin-linked kinase-associated serine/threonine phosphatase 2C